MVQPLLIVDAPSEQPYRYGLQSVAVPQPTDNPHWQLGVEWESIATYDPQIWPGTCFVAEPGQQALPGGAAINTAQPISIYAGVECDALGYTEDYIVSRAQAILQLGWQQAAENALWSGAGGYAPALTSTGNVPLGTGVSMVKGLALLEQWLGQNYNAVGVIHVPRLGGPYMANAHVVNQGNSLQSILGTQYVFGGGYPNTGPGGTAAGADTLWMYATGQVGVRRSAPFVNGGLAQGLIRSTGQQIVFAEQINVLSIDGPAPACVSVDLTKSDPS